MSIFEGPIFILEKAPITLNTDYSTLADERFPLSNLDDRIHPFRPYRTLFNLTSTTTTIVLDLGEDIPRVNAIFLDNTNLAGWHVSSATGISGSYTTYGNGFTGRLDPLTQRGRVFMDLSGEATDNNRYLKLEAPPQTSLNSSDYPSVGAITVGTTGNVVDLPSKGTLTFDFTTSAPTVITDFVGGARESTLVGARFVEVTLPSDAYLRETQETAMTNILNMDTTPFVIFENATLDTPDISRAYLVKHGTTKNKMLYTVGKVFTLSMNFIEVV